MRIWNLRLNLDEFNGLVGSAFTTHDRSDILQGMIVGVNGGELPEDCSKVVRRSFEVCSRWRQEAEGYTLNQSNAGRASVQARKARLGTAQPSKVVRTEPERGLNLTTIHNPQSFNLQHPPPTPLGAGEPSILDPGATANAASTGKSKAKKAWTKGFPEDVLDATSEIMAFWPNESRRQPNSDSRVPRSSGPQLAARLEKIRQSGGELSVCVEIAKRAAGEFEHGKWAKAAENFFGKSEDAPWLAYYQAHTSNLEASDAP